MSLNVHKIDGVGYDSNIYIILAPQPIIIDTGTGFYSYKNFEELKRKVAPEDISKIILTHRHFDHCGGAKYFEERTNAKIYAHHADAYALRRGDCITTTAKMFGAEQPKLEVEPLQHGDIIDIGNDDDLLVIHTPGHSPGSICLYHKATKSLFCGDVVFADGGVGRWDLPGGSLRDLIHSTEKISGFHIKNLYPGHGRHIVGDGDKHVKLALNTLKSYALSYK